MWRPVHSQILREALMARIARNSSYSLRAFARDLGVSHAYLSLVMHGKRKLSVARAKDFSRLALLGETKARQLVESAKEAALLGPAARRRAKSVPTEEIYYRLELDRFKALAEWYHLAILDLTLLNGFRPDPRWVARRLGITAAETREAVRRLERLGLIRISKTKWIKTHRKMEIPTHQAEAAVLHFHQQMIGKALEAARSPLARDYAARDITGTIIATDPKRLTEAKRRAKRFRRRMLQYLSGGKPTELYQLNVQLFRLTQKESR